MKTFRVGKYDKDRLAALPEPITPDRVLAAVEQQDDLGFCLFCGADAEGVERDANGYLCEACDRPSVMGAEGLLIAIA